MIDSMTIMPTENCNLNCEYCCVSKACNKSLNDEDLKKAVKILFYSKYPPHKKTLDISGGEPLMEYEKVKRIIHYAKKLAYLTFHPIQISIVTNGTLLNKENLDYFKKNRVKIGISIDGKGQYNKYRKTTYGRNSFSLVQKKFPLILKYKGNVKIRLTIMPDLARYAWPNFLFFKKLGFPNIAIYPALGVFWKKDEINHFIDASKKILKLQEKEGKTRQERKQANLFCPKNSGHILIDSTGNIYPCKAFAFFEHKKRQRYAIAHLKDCNILQKVREAKACFPKRLCDLFPKYHCKKCLPSIVCSEFCWVIDIKKRKFSAGLAMQNRAFARQVEKVREIDSSYWAQEKDKKV